MKLVLLGQLGHDGLAAKVLGKARLIFADLAFDLIHRLVNGASHIAVGILTDSTEQGAVGTAEHDFNDAAVLLLNGEGDLSLGFLLEKLFQLADLLFGVELDGIVQGDFLAGKCKFHSGCSFPILPLRGKQKGSLPTPSSLLCIITRKRGFANSKRRKKVIFVCFDKSGIARRASRISALFRQRFLLHFSDRSCIINIGSFPISHPLWPLPFGSGPFFRGAEEIKKQRNGVSRFVAAIQLLTS